ncbi:hypothetical protein D7Y13_08930 [Corallococcus praedator]|uniref:Uncharacterized protein n=1 Tax=Corallococcus praedator TaxID=2316724 RepID=A0ABX9QNP4_9BACT|nr:hypothetical protein D7X75_15625 [Corallococcus sp. CA031C]RKI12654.1 hypothetical protein D7Y13_08930 [Corallococcus praedator]
MAVERKEACGLHYSQDTTVAIRVFAPQVILNARVDLVLELLELTWRQRVARERSQALGAIELNAGVSEVIANVIVPREVFLDVVHIFL